MEIKNQNTEAKKLKKLEEPELTVVYLDDNDILTVSCIVIGTKVTMANGSVRNIENIREGDMILTFDHEAGYFTENAVIYAYKGEVPKCAFTLHFANRAVLSVVGEHDLFEKESNKYITVSEDNAEQLVGKHFYSVDEQSYVELLAVTYETEKVDYYEIYSANALNMVANGFLNVADDVDYFLNLYEFDKNLKANEKSLSADIQKYGIFPYSGQYGFTEKEFYNWRMQYINIAVGKGLVSTDYLWEQHCDFLNKRSSDIHSECV